MEETFYISSSNTCVFLETCYNNFLKEDIKTPGIFRHLEINFSHVSFGRLKSCKDSYLTIAGCFKDDVHSIFIGKGGVSLDAKRESVESLFNGI